MKGASLRRQQRHSQQPTAPRGSDAPVPLVFRTHNESLSKASFLFCPRNFHLANPCSGSDNASLVHAASSTSASTAPRLSGQQGAGHDTSGGSPPSRRFPASTSSGSGGGMGDAPASLSPTPNNTAASGEESVRTLVEAIIELRPSFNVPPALQPNVSLSSLALLSPGSPLATASSAGDLATSVYTLPGRTLPNTSVGAGSYVDLMSLSSFASPTLSNAAAAAATATTAGGGGSGGGVTNNSLALTAAETLQGEWLVPAGSPRASGRGASTDFPPSPQQMNSITGGAAGALRWPSPIYSTAALGGNNMVSSLSNIGVSGTPASTTTTTTNTTTPAPTVPVANAVATLPAASRMHPSGGWICRAMAFNDREVVHANGAISVSQSLTSKCPLINEVAKGKIMARVLSSYEEVQERYGLSHVEVTVDNQFVSRSDMFLMAEALRGHILYEGEEKHVCNFRIRVREMLQVIGGSPSIPLLGGSLGGSAAATNTAAYVRVACGIVLPTTRINFQSLSPVHYILLELSREMWETTIDGRIALTWAVRKFIRELLLKQLPKRKASPLIRIVFTGRLRPELQFGEHGDIFHMLELPREVRHVDVVEEIRMHCEAMVDRVLLEVRAAATRRLEEEMRAYYTASHRGERHNGEATMAGTADNGRRGSPKRSATSSSSPVMEAAFEAYVRQRRATIAAITAKRLFVHAKRANTMEALSILLERSSHHYIDRHLTFCGHAVTIVSAGKGFYQVTNNLVQIVCARLHDMGLEQVHVVCIGRPPLHVTPLLEYTSADDSLRSQYHLHSRVLAGAAVRRGGGVVPEALEVECFYESPEWMSVFFFHSSSHNNGGETVFELLPKECWQREHPMLSILSSAPRVEQADGTWAAGIRLSNNSNNTASNVGGAVYAEGGRRGGEGGGDAANGTIGQARNNEELDDAPSEETVTVRASNPPLLIPGLGLRIYPVPEVTLPVEAAAAPGRDGGSYGNGERYARTPSISPVSALRGHSSQVISTDTMTTANTFTGASLHTGVPEMQDLSAIGSYSTERLASPTTPGNPHASPYLITSSLGARGGGVAGTGVGGVASSPLLVRTTTASSSIFASPTVPTRHSMPQMGFDIVSHWRGEPHQAIHGLNSTHTATQPRRVNSPMHTSGAAATAEFGGGLRKSRAATVGSLTGVVAAAAAGTASGLPSASAAAGGRVSNPSSLTSYSTSQQALHHQHCHRPLHVSHSLDHKTGLSYPEYQHLSVFEQSIRSAESSLPGKRFSPSQRDSRRPQLLGRDGFTTRSSMSSVFAPVQTAAFAGPQEAPIAGHEERFNTVTATAAGRAVGAAKRPFARCSWYCLHAAKMHHDGGGPPTTVGSSSTGGGGAGRREQRGMAAAVISGSGSAPSGRSLLRSALPTGDAPSIVSPGLHPERSVPDGVSSLFLPAAAVADTASSQSKPWHKALTCARSDAVCCGCNVVDSDLRNGYLILEITIDAAVLPHCFWSPRIIVDDQWWTALMNAFAGRDDRVMADATEESVFFLEATPDDEDSLTVGEDSEAEGRGISSAAASSTSVPAESGLESFRDGFSGGQRVAVGRSPTVESGDAYRFESAFRPSEVFCHTYSGISADGRTLILPTHNNHVLLQSSEEILFRFHPRLFVRVVDEGGDAAVDLRGPVSPTPSHHQVALSEEEAANLSSGGGAGSDLQDVSTTADRSISTAASSRQHTAERIGVDVQDAASLPSSESRTGNTELVAQRSGQDHLSPSAGPTIATNTLLPQPNATLEAKGTQSGPADSVSSPGRGRMSPSRGSAKAAAPSLLAAPPSSAKPAPPPSAAVPPLAAGGVGLLTKSKVARTAPPMSVRPPPTPTAATAGISASMGDRHGTKGPAAVSTPCSISYAAFLSAVPMQSVVTVGYVQLRNSLLFAIKPTNPLRPSAEEELREDTTAVAQSAESVSTATVWRRRWQWQHPDIAWEPPQEASWTRLCTCRLLPLYGSKPAYPRDSFYTVSPHQYTVTKPGASASAADTAGEQRRLLEFVLQRLQQQYQIVVDASGLAAGAQWPRADPQPNARLELSLGHQTHTLKVGETAKSISVSRMLHRGMYSNGQVTHMLSYRYLLWNYLADEFAVREVHMEAQVGERNAFRWESLDRWLQNRPEVYIPRGPDLWLRSREVAVMLLPEDPAHPPDFDEFYRFIGYRFSAHLSTHGTVEWRRHDDDITMDIADPTPSTIPPPPPLMDVVLVHDNPNSLDTRTALDRVTGRTLAFEVPVEERLMSVDVTLPQLYNPRCCYFLKVSWLVCAASVVTDWYGSFIATAARFHLHAVPISCYYHSSKAESLTAHYDVVASCPAEEPLLRKTLAELLLSAPFRYYPDTPNVNRNCRLVHLSGLCCVILPPSASTVAQWYQNAALRQGTVEQKQLLEAFKEAESRARAIVAAMMANGAAA